MLSDMPSNAQWTKSKTACLYRYNPTSQYFARVRFGGKLHRKKLGTDDYQLARRKLAAFRRDLGHTDSVDADIRGVPQYCRQHSGAGLEPRGGTERRLR